AFSDETQTLAQYIQTLRLEACIRDLHHPMAQSRPITDIALSWGFNNASHFSRVFREHTGMSPSEFRAASPA
ncbi:MAG: helix-turn-helix transcriptional regulator, partial [Curvibacter sp.]